MKRCTINANIVLSLSIGLALGFVVINSQAAPTARPLSRSMDPVSDPVGNTHIALTPLLNSTRIFSATLNVRAYIDGRSRLLVQGDTVHWHHLDWAAPGRLEGANAPTYLNGVAWYPTWPDIPDPENRDCDCDSSTYVGIPPLAMQDQSATLDILLVRDGVTIIQQPNAVNGYTLIVEFDDPDDGADWYEINLDYISYGVNLTPPTQTGSGEAGSTVSYTVRLANQTGVSDSFSLTLGSHIWDTALSADSLGPVAHGDPLTFTVDVTIPVDAAWYLSDTVVVTATSATSPVYSDTATLTTQAYAPPSISVSPDVLTSAQYVNEIVTKPLTISNGNGVTLTFNLAGTSVVDDFDTDSGLWIYGQNAYRDAGNGYVVLAEPSSDQVGTLWLKDQIEQPFVAEFRYKAGGRSGSDGFVFMFYKDSNYEPQSGGCLGFGDGEDCAASGYGIEFDSYEWNPGDPPTPHIALIKDTPGNHLAYVGDPRVIDNQWHQVRVEVGTGSITVELDGEQVLTWQGSLDTSNTGFGFGGASGGGIQGCSVLGYVAPSREACEGSHTSNAEILRTNWHIIDDVSLETTGGLPNWLTAEPMSDTISADSSLAIQVAFNTAGVQPGTYTTTVAIQSNDPVKRLTPVPVTMTVNPTANMGWVEGTVTDAATGTPLTATIIALGQPYTVTTKPNGTYKLWLDAGSYTLQASATGYITATAVVSITAQQGITQGFALVLNVPRLSVSPESLQVTHSVGDVTTRVLTITNTGPAPLTFNLASAPTVGTVLLMRLDESAGATSFRDDSGNSNHGSCSGTSCPTAGVSGKFGQALSFDGKDDYVEVLDDAGFDFGTGDFTVSAWIKTTATTSTGSGRDDILAKGDPTISGFAISAEYNQAAFWVGPSGACFGSSVLNDGEWHYIVGTRDSSNNGSGKVSTDTSQVKLYHPNNIVLYVDSVSECTGINSENVDTGYSLFIGKHGTKNESYFDGSIDQVIIYDRALSAEEVEAIYLSGPGGPDDPWLSKAPISGTVGTNSSQIISVTFNSTGLQPNTYTTTVVVMSNDPAKPLTFIPVTMTVNPTANMGWVEGTVTDAWTGLPLTATVELMGVYSKTANPNYTIWASAGTYSLTAHTSSYYTVARSVTINASGLVTVDLALEPAQPRLEWMPMDISTTAVVGGKVNRTWMISNTGPLPLTIALYEISPTASLPALGALPADMIGKRILYDCAHGEPPLSDYSTLASDVISAGAVITEIWHSPIDAAVLRGYDVLWANCCGGTAWGFGELTAVQDWLNQGGAVFVQGENSRSIAGLASIFGVNYQSGNCTSGTTTNIGDYPIHEGVSTVNVDGTCWRLATSSAAKIVVFGPQGQPHVVAQEQNGGKMVVVASEDFTNWYINNNDNRRLANNILRWLANPGYGDVPWLSEAPVTSTIPGHSSLPVTLGFDVTTLSAGDYRAMLALEHNAPSRPSPVEVPVALTVNPYKVFLPILLKRE